MYKITETPDKGLVISGNNSFNHDDNYMVKLYPDCNANQTYDIPGSGPSNSYTLITGGLPGPINVNAKLVIPSGTVVTVYGNTKIQFADELMTGKPAGFEVHPGGVLRIENGAIITSIDNSTCPGSMWSGICVIGTSTANQGALYDYTNVATQGILTISDATISNARTAITTGSQFPNHNFDWSTTGGIIKAENAVFLNNHRDVQYLVYASPTSPNANKGLFRRCKFLTTSKLNDGSVPIGRFSMYEVRGIAIRGCEFEYLAGNAYAPYERGYGILSADASFNIEDDCQWCITPYQSKFTDFRVGIAVHNSNPLRIVNVDHAIFTMNSYSDFAVPRAGVFLTGSFGSKITRNYFSADGWIDQAVNLEQSKYYSIANNTVIASGGGMGFHAFNSDGGTHKMYRNKFSGTVTGITPVDYNSLPGPTWAQPANDGLRMNCNIFENTYYDIYMYHYQKPYTYVAMNQGILTDAITLDNSEERYFVRNQYSAPCGDSQWHITQTDKATMHPSFAEQNTQPCTNTGSKLTVIPVASKHFTFDVHCPELDGVTQKDACPCRKCCLDIELATAFTAAKRMNDSLQNNFDILIDGGNTGELLATIESWNSSDSDLFDYLVDKSPYLSDTVLKFVIQNEILSPIYVAELHNLNKPFSDNVWPLFEGNSYYESVWETLVDQQDDYFVSIRKSHEDLLGRSISDLEFITASKVSYHAADSLEGARDSTIAYLSMNRKLESVPIIRARAYLDAGEKVRAINFADSLNSIDDFSEISGLLYALLRLDTMPGKIHDIVNHPEILETVEQFASDTLNPGCWWAKTIMSEVYGAPIHIRTIIPPTGERKGRSAEASNPSDESESKIDKSFYFKIFPNPMKKSFKLVCNTSESRHFTIRIQDLLGKAVFAKTINSNVENEINIETLPNGLFFVSLIHDNSIIASQKIIIEK